MKKSIFSLGSSTPILNIPRETFDKLVYYSISSIIILSCLIYFDLIIFVKAFYLSQINFVISHMVVHRMFIDKKKMTIGVLIAERHHHKNPRMMPENAMKHRLGFLFSRQTLLVSVLLLCTNNVVFYCNFMFLWWLQQPIHDWYHQRDKSFFFLPLRLLLYSLEFIGIISQEKHENHHKYHVKGNDEEKLNVVDFFDIYDPIARLINPYVNQFWNKIKHSKNFYTYLTVLNIIINILFFI